MKLDTAWILGIIEKGVENAALNILEEGGDDLDPYMTILVPEGCMEVLIGKQRFHIVVEELADDEGFGE